CACGDDGFSPMGDGGGVDAVDAAPDTPDAPMIDMPAIPTGCVAGRVTADRPDDSAFDQIRALYVLPSDAVDRQFDTNDKICNSLRGVSAWFHTQSNVYFRLDTSGDLIDVGFVRLNKTDAQMRGTDTTNTSIDTGTAFVRERIERELKAMGLIASNKLYAVYYEGSSVYACGGGAYPPLIKARVGAVYLRGMPPGVTVPCGDSFPWGQPSLVPSYIDYAILHELVHSMGIVPTTSPNEHAQGHVFDTASTTPARDLMYSPRTSGDPAWATNNPSGLLIDINRDDYFNAGTVDLATMSLISPLPSTPHRPNGW
ncbi:MAG TPA: hypothetical protein VMZ53_06515, partial [Kofleriaceae bacterium]|nr:hypothetical protein [Kofleriaceae bacterium]